MNDVQQDRKMDGRIDKMGWLTWIDGMEGWWMDGWTGWEEGRKEGREGGREGGKEGGREGGRKDDSWTERTDYRMGWDVMRCVCDGMG
jgi:hypothetical protein